MEFQDLRRLLQDALARLELPRRLQELTRWLLALLRRLSLPIERREEVLEELERASSPGFDFFLLVVLSCAIATFGLLTDSTAVIIGAMLVAPLMSPILGLSLASVSGERRMFEQAIQALALGVLLAVGLSAFVAWTAHLLPFGVLEQLPDEVLSRTRPSPFDLGIALAGGMAAAYALAQPRISAALPGVAIATALMPPLCTVGVGLAVGSGSVALGALLLFLTNLTAISFAGIATFVLLGFRPGHLESTWHGLPRSVMVSAVLMLVTLIPLVVLSLRFVNDARQQADVRAAVQAELAAWPQVELVDLRINGDDQTLHLRLVVRSPEPFSYQQVVELQNEVAVLLDQTVSLQMDVIPAARLDPLVPPTHTPTPTPGPTATPTATFTATPTVVVPSATPTPTATFTATPLAGYIISTGDQGVILRDAPGGGIIAFLPEGAGVQVLLGRQTVDGVDWLEVRDLFGRSGWVPAAFILVRP